MSMTEKCDEGRKILVVGPFCWGQSDSLKKAKQQCKASAPEKGSPYYPKKGLKFFGYSVAADGGYVDDLGYIYSTDEYPTIRLGEV